MEKDAAIGEAIEAWLARLLNRSVSIEAYRQVGRGISGAAAYRVTFDGGEAFLKVMPASSPAYVRARAERELAFYRRLAGRVPLRVPRVVAMHADAHGCALLLTAYQASPPPDRWQEQWYVQAAQHLGRFHAAYWNRSAALAEESWLPGPRPGATQAEMEQALVYWRSLCEQPRFTGILSERVMQWVQRLVTSISAVDAIVDSLPPALCHGDCNPGNVLFDAGGDMVWADWHEVRLARGPEDLSFFLQQAAIAGGVVPFDAALSAYRERLVAGLGEDVALSAIRRAVEAAELRSRTLQWPAYLGDATAAELDAMLQRIRELAVTLQIAV